MQDGLPNIVLRTSVLIASGSAKMDIEKLISDVTKRERTFESLTQERAHLLAKTASLDTVVQKLSESEKRLNIENRNLRDSLTNLEESFLRKYDYKNECSELRKRLSKTESESSAALNKLQKELQAAQQKLVADERLYQAQSRKREEEFEARILSMQVEKETEIQSIMDQIQDDKNRLDQTIRAREAEISKLKIDYEARMKRMNEHIMKLQNNASSNHTGTEIFRKKLQHERDTFSKKILELERQISELRSQLTDSNKPQKFIAAYSRHIVNTSRSSSSKRRKLN